MNFQKSSVILERRKTKLFGKIQNLRNLLKKISLLRLFSFLSIVVYFSVYYFSRTENLFYLLGLVVLTIVFIYLIKKFKDQKRYEFRLKSFCRLIENEIDRANMNFRKLNRIDILKRDFGKSVFYKDLDVLTKDGLFSLLDTTQTIAGEKKFIRLLLCEDDETSSEILQRQNIIKKLSLDKTGSLKYLRIWGESGDKETDTKIDLRVFSRNIPNLLNNKILKIGFKVLSISTIVSIIVSYFFSLNFFTPTFVFLQLILFVLFRQKILQCFKPYRGLFNKAKSLRRIFIFISKKKKKLGLVLSNEDEASILTGIDQLEKIMNRMTIIYSPMVHFILNFTLLWDFWLLDSLAKWQRQYFRSLNEWSESVIFFDSIIPFYHYHFHNPENIFPEISDSFEKISARNLSHPLIQRHKRVKNDLQEISFKNVNLITGSNMSGKTTFLRTIGVNCVLALCGSSVPAESFSLPPVKILTSIRNEDSLSEGTSFFYAEVKKISKILKLTREGKKTIVLLDEILKGTNSRERFIASRAILKELQKQNAISFVTTHDLELAKGLSDIKQNHFSEVIESGVMSFDYKIHDGIVKSSNALKILELEGLNLHYDDDV